MLCLAQASMLILGNVGPALAASSLSKTEMTRLEQYERTLFGAPRTRLSDEQRLSGLENNIFGVTKTGGTDNRLDKIQAALGLDPKSSPLNPPMAAQMDHVPIVQPPNVVAQQEPESPAQDLLQDAMSQYQAGDLTNAEQTFKRVLTVDRNNPDAYYNLGVIYEGKGDLQKALENYQRASQLNPSDGELRNTVASVRSKLDSGKQAQLAEQRRVADEQRQQQQTAQKKDSLRQLVASASNDYKSGNFAEAARKLEKVAADAPSDPDVQYALGQAYKAKGDVQQAKMAFNRAMSIDPNSQLYKNAYNELSGSIAQASRSSQIDDTPPGQIQPFAGSPSPNLNGMASNNFEYRGGGAMSSFKNSRLKRAVAGGAVGAAAGALWSATSRSSLKSGAMRGALLGGMLGYFSGGNW